MLPCLPRVCRAALTWSTQHWCCWSVSLWGIHCTHFLQRAISVWMKVDPKLGLVHAASCLRVCCQSCWMACCRAWNFAGVWCRGWLECGKLSFCSIPPTKAAYQLWMEHTDRALAPWTHQILHTVSSLETPDCWQNLISVHWPFFALVIFAPQLSPSEKWAFDQSMQWQTIDSCQMHSHE